MVIKKDRNIGSPAGLDVTGRMLPLVKQALCLPVLLTASKLARWRQNRRWGIKVTHSRRNVTVTNIYLKEGNAVDM